MLSRIVSTTSRRCLTKRGGRTRREVPSSNSNYLASMASNQQKHITLGVRGFATRKKDKKEEPEEGATEAAATGKKGKDKSKPKPGSLEEVISKIEASFGQGTVMKLDGGSLSATSKPIDVVPTGSLGLDIALGVGGVPRGRITEIFGPESSGKTTLALSVIAQAQQRGGTGVFIDAEHALDVAWAKKLGVNADKMLVCQPDSGEQALEVADSLIQTGQIDVIVIDSVAALVPRQELEGEMGQPQIGLQARLMSQAMRKLTASLAKSKTALIFINQIRMKIGVMFGNPETTSGGTALKYFSSIRMDIRKIGSVKKGDDIVASQMRVKIVKNKCASPFKSTEFDIEYGKGLSKSGEILDMGLREGILEKSGAWYSIAADGRQLGQGREKAKAYLEENPEIAQELDKLIREKDAVIDDLLEDETKVEPEDAAAPVVTEKVIEKEA